MEHKRISKALKHSDERVERDQLKSLLTVPPSCTLQPDTKTLGFGVTVLTHVKTSRQRAFLRFVFPEGKVCIVELQSN